MLCLSKEQLQEAVRMLLNGRSQRDVANHFRVHKSIVSRLYDRLRTTGTTDNRPRPGRARVTTRREDAFMRQSHLRNRFQTPEETARNIRGPHNNRICRRTVSNRIREAGIRARRPYVGLPLTRARQRRMDWLQRHHPGLFSMARWRWVMFSDEFPFLLFRSDRRQHVYCSRGECFVDACVREQDRFGGRGVMVWAGICHGHKTELVFVKGALNAQSYPDTILQPVVVPFIRHHNVTFQKDNACPHVAKICNEYLQANNIDVLPWPAFSPDLS